MVGVGAVVVVVAEGDVDGAVARCGAVGLVARYGGEQGVVGSVVGGGERVLGIVGQQLAGAVGSLQDERVDGNERRPVGTAAARHQARHHKGGRHKQYATHGFH